MQFTPDQQQVIIGTLLGNSKLEVGKDGPYLIMRSRDLSWFASKAEFLADFCDKTWQQYSNYYWQSKANECFEPFLNICYDGTSKIVTMDCLDRLRDIAIMVWYGDTGCLVGRNRCNACLRTQAFGNTSYVVERFFNEVGIFCGTNKVRGKPVVVFTHEGTRTLMKIIGPILPKNRYHLIPTA